MLPRKLSGTRYLSSAAFNSYITLLQPNAGQATDGTPLPPTTVISNIHAHVEMWRGKETDKAQVRTSQSSYKVVIHYPKTYSLDAGMLIQVTNGPLLNIESLSDPDGQRVEMHVWAWAENPTS